MDRRASGWTWVWTILVVVPACSGSGTAEPTAPSLDPVTTTAAAPPTTARVAPTSTTGATTSSAPATSTTTPLAATSTTDAPQPTSTTPPSDSSSTPSELTGPTFSEALGVKVDSAPGVNTPGDTRELIPGGLWVHIAWAPDPNDSSVFTARPEDIAILEAYANAVRVYYLASTTTVTVDPEMFDDYYLDAGAKYEDAFARHRAAGEHEDISAGVVLRPYVLGDHRSDVEAVVLDCLLDGGTWTTSASSGATQRRNGLIATMRLTDGVWKVDVLASEERACV